MYRNSYRIFRFYNKSFTFHPKSHTQDPPIWDGVPAAKGGAEGGSDAALGLENFLEPEISGRGILKKNMKFFS